MGLHGRHAPDSPVRLTVADDASGLTLTVVDVGPAAGPVLDDPGEGLLAGPDTGSLDELADPDVALAVLHGLVDEVTVQSQPGETVVTMHWPLPTDAVGARATVVAQR